MLKGITTTAHPPALDANTALYTQMVFLESYDVPTYFPGFSLQKYLRARASIRWRNIAF